MFCPFRQIAVIGDLQPQIVVQFLINIDERRRDRHIFVHGKAQAVGLSVPVIGILAENNDFYVFKGRQIERVENSRARRKDQAGFILAENGFVKLPVIRLGKFPFKSFVPLPF